MGETCQYLRDFLSVILTSLWETTCFLILLWENLIDQKWEKLGRGKMKCLSCLPLLSPVVHSRLNVASEFQQNRTLYALRF